MPKTKQCLTCSTTLRGRADKKFCDDQCRTVYNNSIKVITKPVKAINAALRKNRKILEDLVPAEAQKIIVPSQKLMETGFNFTYHTHTSINPAGASLFFCYEYGYMQLENTLYMLVKSPES